MGGPWTRTAQPQFQTQSYGLWSTCTVQSRKTYTVTVGTGWSAEALHGSSGTGSCGPQGAMTQSMGGCIVDALAGDPEVHSLYVTVTCQYVVVTSRSPKGQLTAST